MLELVISKCSSSGLDQELGFAQSWATFLPDNTLADKHCLVGKDASMISCKLRILERAAEGGAVLFCILWIICNGEVITWEKNSTLLALFKPLGLDEDCASRECCHGLASAKQLIRKDVGDITVLSKICHNSSIEPLHYLGLMQK